MQGVMSPMSARKATGKTPNNASATAHKLRQLGLCTPQDFIVHLPMRYEDETRLDKVADLRPGQTAQLDVEVVHSHIRPAPHRQLHAQVADATGRLNLRWLHFYANQQKRLVAGQRVRVRGEVRQGYEGLEIVHPRLSAADAPLANALTPVYPATAGLSQTILRRAIERALDEADLSDTLPEALQAHYALMPFDQAIHVLHRPPPDVSLALLRERGHPAWRRIKFDELLAQQLSLALARAQRQRQRAHPLAVAQGPLWSALHARLPFQLTSAQQRVIEEIRQDLQRPFPMHRLLQGDVGSGKTVVAAFAAAQALDSGDQVAIMAPTEILASQHVNKLIEWLSPLGVKIVSLTGRLSAKARQTAIDAIGQGAAQLVIGTQALIQEGIAFARLGLMIVDEQHRFGVGQRLALSRKGEALPHAPDAAKRTDMQTDAALTWLPHQLHMSATPIPRTLAMTFLADLDSSVLDELPPGRTPVVTKLISTARREAVLQGVAKQVRQRRQAYWVCPLVQESEALQLQAAQDTHAQLQQAWPDVRIGLVHGKLPLKEKAQVMDAFRQGELDVLVATSVIEVGVDVPNASIMVIEHAERFGLAQLHQLRGRVGRGATESICVLLYQPPLSPQGAQRLRAMYETTDGFEIARRDLAQRGPGEFLGLRQSGTEILRFANLDTDGALLEQAAEATRIMQKQYPDHVYAHLQRWMKGRQDLLRT